MNTTATQDAYIASRTRKAAEIRDLSRRVAEALRISTGDQWSYTPHAAADHSMYEHAMISGPDAQRLHIRRGHPTNRLQIYGDFAAARDYRARGERHEITVSAERRPADIARDIARRLLPSYVTSLAKARAAQAAWEAKQARQEALAAELCALASGSYYHGTTERFYFYGTTRHPERRSSSEVEVFPDLSMSIKAGALTAEQARAIIAILTAPAQADQPAAPEAQAADATSTTRYILAKAACPQDYLGSGAAFIGEPEGRARVVAIEAQNVEWQQGRLSSGMQHLGWSVYTSEAQARTAARQV
ncbi:MAG: hypothetical protein H0T53_11640 [Herpetosiphonaceae bacterium]|nr:hypothetical protein [Herpetosiphonaceae bacterium]